VDANKHTDFDNRVLAEIVIFARQHRYPPSIRDLMAVCGVTSTSTIHQALDRLARDRRIKRGAGKVRALSVVEGE
jgi:SOS-response transcriptional repressor LexA